MAEKAISDQPSAISGFLILPPVSVFQPDDVVQLRRRHLEDVAVFNRRHAVDRLWRDVDALARLHLTLLQASALVDLEEQPARVQVDRLVLHVVILQAQRVARVDVNQLADVPLGLCPMELVAPGFFHARDLAHDVTPLMSVSRPSAASSTRSMSSTVASFRTRRAIARSSSCRSSPRTCLATGIAPGVMLNSVRPSPTSSVSSAGSDAISPQSETGIR